jgi:outer membrane lipoprotein
MPAGSVAVVVLCSALASACAISQPSPPAGDQVVSDITVRQAQADERLVESVTRSSQPADSALPVVRWGGTIAQVSNRADDVTVVEIVSRPLYSGGRPIHDDRTDGRFLAEINEFLDPEIVKVGRDMTVVGRLSRRQAGTVGESSYLFPVVEVDTYRYWKQVVPVQPRSFPHWNTYPYGRYYDPFWDDWPFYPRYRPRH